MANLEIFGEISTFGFPIGKAYESDIAVSANLWNLGNNIRGNKYLLNPTVAGIVITLPANPPIGYSVAIKNTSATNNLTINNNIGTLISNIIPSQILTIISSASANGWSIFNISNETISSGGFNPERVITVAQTGGDFADVRDAVISANGSSPTSADPIIIFVYPGTYVNASVIVLNPFVTLKGVSNKSVILQNTGGSCISMNDNSSLENVTINNTSTVCVSNNTTGNNIKIKNVIMENAATGLDYNAGSGLILSDCIFLNNTVGINSDGTFGIYKNCMLGGNTTGIVNSNTVMSQYFNFIIKNSNIGIQCVSSGVYIKDAVLDNTLNLKIDGTPELSIVDSCIFEPGSNLDIEFKNNVAHELRIQSCTINQGKIVKFSNNDVRGFLFLYGQRDSGLSVRGELQVGTPDQPQESVFGAGDSTGQLLDGVRFFYGEAANNTDPVANLTEQNDFNNQVNTNLFNGITADQCLLLASEKFLFSGFKINITTSSDLVDSSNLLVEYWNGSVWAIADRMITLSNEPFLPIDYKNLFQLGNYQIRLGSTRDPDSKNTRIDQVLLTIGTVTAYWIRLRLVAALSIMPTTDLIKLHTNRTEINSTGYIEYFNDAQIRKAITIPIRLTESVNSTPQNENVYIGQDAFGNELSIKGVDNSFRTGSNRFLSIPFEFPNDIDTSKGLTFELRFFGTSVTPGDVLFSIGAGYIVDFEDDSGSLSDVSDNPIGLQAAGSLDAYDRLRTINVGQKFLSVVFNLRIEPILSARDRSNGSSGSGLGDLLFIRFGRLGGNAADTYNGNIVGISLRLIYTAYNNGIDF